MEREVDVANAIFLCPMSSSGKIFAYIFCSQIYRIHIDLQRADNGVDKEEEMVHILIDSLAGVLCYGIL